MFLIRVMDLNYIDENLILIKSNCWVKTSSKAGNLSVPLCRRQ